MEVKDLKVSNPHGLHLRVAAQIVQKSRDYKSRIIVCKGYTRAQVTSILDLLLLGAEKGTELRIIAEGEDEKQAIHDISEVLTDGAGI